MVRIVKLHFESSEMRDMPELYGEGLSNRDMDNESAIKEYWRRHDMRLAARKRRKRKTALRRSRRLRQG